jgi:hypothetical protein
MREGLLMTTPAPEETNGGEMPEDPGIVLPIEWHIPEGLATRYTTNYVVQQTEHEFIISFFEIVPPILLGPPDEVRAAAESITSIRATCVGRVVVAAERMPDLIRILRENMEKYHARHGQEETHD